jgi:hypothetical protein
MLQILSHASTEEVKIESYIPETTLHLAILLLLPLRVPRAKFSISLGSLHLSQTGVVPPLFPLNCFSYFIPLSNYLFLDHSLNCSPYISRVLFLLLIISTVHLWLFKNEFLRRGRWMYGYCDMYAESQDCEARREPLLWNGCANSPVARWWRYESLISTVEESMLRCFVCGPYRGYKTRNTCRFDRV